MKKYILKEKTDLLHAVAELEQKAEQFFYESDQPLVLTLEDYQPDRSSQQNKLMWVKNNIVAKQHGCHPNYAHALSKRVVLLPYMLGLPKHHARAQIITDDIKDNEDSLALLKCFDLVRSSDLTKAEFTEYLDMMTVYWSFNGVTFPDEVIDAKHRAADFPR